MQQLIAGIRAFREEGFAEDEALYRQLASRQSPHTLLVTCSDSRIVPHRVVGLRPGDLFVVRNAGNMVPEFTGAGDGEEAAVEFAVAGLGVQHVVVCGHSDCGAMNGLLDPEATASLPTVAAWLAKAGSTRAAVAAQVPEDASDSERLQRAVELNVLVQVDRLRRHPAVAGALAQGAVHLHAWVYHIGSGVVEAYDPAAGRFVEVVDALFPIDATTPLPVSSGGG